MSGERLHIDDRMIRKGHIFIAGVQIDDCFTCRWRGTFEKVNKEETLFKCSLKNCCFEKDEQKARD